MEEKQESEIKKNKARNEIIFLLVIIVILSGLSILGWYLAYKNSLNSKLAYEVENSIAKTDPIIVVNDAKIQWDGEYNRTNVNVNNKSSLQISDSNKESFMFEMDAINGGNLGHVDGKANILSEGKAQFKDYEGRILTFSYKEKNIEVSSTGFGLGYFGAGVYIDGLYTSEKPTYLTSDIDSKLFDNDKYAKRLKIMLGVNIQVNNDEKALLYKEIKEMFNASYSKNESIEGFSVIYSSFVSGIGKRVDIGISKDNKIYIGIVGSDNLNNGKYIEEVTAGEVVNYDDVKVNEYFKRMFTNSNFEKVYAPTYI